MADPRSFFKLHNGMPENPKVAGLSDAAFRALIELWCYCSRNLTDGNVAPAMANRLASATALAELTAAGLVEDHGDNLYMHDYLKHQQSKAEVEQTRENRRKAGALGGRAKASALASAKQEPKQTPSKSVADTDTDTDNSRKARKRATPLPPDWKPTKEHQERAAQDGIDLDREVIKFRAWADEGHTSKSWNGRFTRWLIQAGDYAKERRPQNQTDKPSLWDVA